MSFLPAALAAYFVLGLYLETGISFFAFARTLVVAVVLARAAWVVASLLLRDRSLGTVTASVATVVVLFAGGSPALALATAGIATLAALGVSLARRGRHGRELSWPNLVPLSNRLVVVVAIAAVISVLQHRGSVAPLPADFAEAARLAAGPPVAVAAGANAPDIYVLLLEDHLRADTLERRFGMDSQPFLGELEDLGFRVAPRSRSNYSATLLSLLSMFQMRHLDAIPELDGLRAGVGDRQPLLRELIDSAPAFALLRSHGYEIVGVSLGFEEVALRGADRFVDSGQLSDLETYVLHVTPAGGIVDSVTPSFYGDQLRGRVRASFETLGMLARERVAHPRLIFVHILPPHAPLLFGRHGEPLVAPLSDPWAFDLSHGWDAFRQRYVDQLAYLHELTVTAMRDLAATARQPYVAIVMSEEGARFNVDWTSDEGRADAVSTLFAARVPDGGDPFGPSITLVNVFPTLLDRYLGETVPRQPDRNLIADPLDPFHLVEFANTDAAAP